MVHIMKANGSMGKLKDMENHVKKMEIFMKGSFMKGQKMAKVNLLGGRVVRAMKENFKIIKYVEKDYIFLVIIGNMKDIGKIIK